MIIQTSANGSAICLRKAAGLPSYVAEPHRSISVTADIAHSVPAAVGTPVPIGSGLLFKAVKPAPGSGGDEEINKALKKLARSALSDIKQAFPDAKAPIEGVELCLATKEAFDALTDPDRKSLAKPLVKTARAMAGVIDLVDCFVPGIKDNPYIEMAIVIVKIGDKAYQVHSEVSADRAGATLMQPRPRPSQS